MRQRRNIANGQSLNLAAAEPLGLSNRRNAIRENAPGVDQERVTYRTAFRLSCDDQAAHGRDPDDVFLADRKRQFGH